MKAATTEGDQVRLDLELLHGTDVRSLVKAARWRYGDADLLARRSVERPLQRPATTATGPLSELTERQQELLRTTYFSGYFEWPRVHSGEEVAAALDIAQPTFHRHLRVAEERVFAVLLDGTDTVPSEKTDEGSATGEPESH